MLLTYGHILDNILRLENSEKKELILQNIIKCYASKEFLNNGNLETNIPINIILSKLYTSTCTICYNKNQLLKSNSSPIDIYIGSAFIKLSSPKYYFTNYKGLIIKFIKKCNNVSSNRNYLNKLSPNDKNIISEWMESKYLSQILEGGNCSIDEYNKTLFSGSKCSKKDNNIIKNSDQVNEEICVNKTCPNTWILKDKTEKKIDESKTIKLEDRIKNYNEKEKEEPYEIGKKYCCKSFQDAELDCLLAIIRNIKKKGNDIIQQYNILDQFINNKLLNSTSEEYLGNYGFFSIQNNFHSMHPCWICKKWLNTYGCNYFNCTNFYPVLRPKINFETWINNKRYNKFSNILYKNKKFNIKTSRCKLFLDFPKKNINFLIRRLYEKKFSLSYWKYNSFVKKYNHSSKHVILKDNFKIVDYNKNEDIINNLKLYNFVYDNYILYYNKNKLVFKRLDREIQLLNKKRIKLKKDEQKKIIEE